MAKLYRSMTTAADGLPVIARSTRGLGVRTPAEVPPGVQPDVTEVDPSDIIQPGTGGMSCAPDHPINLARHRRPPQLGGVGKDPVWEIDESALGPLLRFDPDHPGATHGVAGPAAPMTLAEYEAALAATRARWTLWSGP